jgi:ATP-dependent DNA ligase
MMLADKIVDPYDKTEVEKKITFPCSGEIKYDGIRLQAEVFPDNQGYMHCILTSRRGKNRTDDYPEICMALKNLFEGQDVILDGEIISSSFQELTRKDSKATKKYIVFDLLNDEKLKYKYRWANLFNMLNGYETDNIQLANHFDLNNYEEFIEAFEFAVHKEEEGIMIKLDDRPYERDTRKHMFKVKKVYTADLRIIGFNYGEGKRAGKVGSLQLETEDKLLKVDVGSGITDDLCEELTNQINNIIDDTHPPAFIGKIAEIAYNELTETGSIRFPRLIRIRDEGDKDYADKLEDLDNR